MRVYVAIALLALSVLAASGANAYFDMDERLIGTPVRTVLPDGRVHLKLPEKVNEPFPEGIDFAQMAQFGDIPKEALSQDNHLSVRGEVIMKAHWQVFKVDEHSDIGRMLCHDTGDKNMRLSLFGASDKLIDYLKSKKESIVLTADANKHKCHGMPIFRQVTDVKFIAGDKDEVLLTTHKANYQHIFDEADIALDIEHPKLTHIHSNRMSLQFDANAKDHGVFGESLSLTPGARAVPASTDRMFPTQNMMNREENLEKVRHLAEGHLSTEERARVAKQLGWFSSIVKAVTNVVKTVVNTVKSAVSTVVNAVGKGISSAVNFIKNLVTINIDKNIDQKLFDISYTYTKQISIVTFTFTFRFYAGMTFKLKIVTNSLHLVHASVYGGVDFSAAASIPRTARQSNGQSTLYTINGPRITFAIGPVPVWIEIDIPIIASYDIDYAYAAKAGFAFSAYCRIGVEYSNSNGFNTIFDKSFTKSHTLQYSLDVEATALIGPQVKASLYGMVGGYVNVFFGVTVSIHTPRECNVIQLKLNLVLRISAGLSIDISILGFSIYSKSWGPWNLYSMSWPMLNVCKQSDIIDAAAAALKVDAAEERALYALQRRVAVTEDVYEEHDVSSLRNAIAASSDKPTTALGVNDSGKVWHTEVNCNANLSYDFTVTGLFNPNATLFYIAMCRNYSLENGSYTLTTQTMLSYLDGAIALGLKGNASLVAPTKANADALGIDEEELNSLSDSASGNPNISAVLPISWLWVDFSSTDLESVSFSNPFLCPPQGQSSVGAKSAPLNTTVPAPPPAGSMFGRMFAAFADSLFPAFVRLITDVLVTVLILAILEIVVAMFVLPRVIGVEHWPKQPQTPRTREYIYLGIAIATGIVCYITFIVGMNVNFAQIVGANVQANYTPPTNPDPRSFLVASGVETTVFDFTGAQVKRRVCKQYFPCSPNCRDLCVDTVAPGWVDAALLWPYCPADAVKTDNGGCTKVAFDAIADAILSILFLVVFAVIAVFKTDNVYRRLPIMHACLMLSGMFLCLLWRRVDSFMQEVTVTMFAPTTRMVIPFALFMNADSEKSWESAISVFFTMVGLIGVAGIWEMYNFYIETLEGRIVKFDETFEGGNDAAMSGYKKSGEKGAAAKEPAGVAINGDGADLTGSIAFRAEVAAELGAQLSQA